VRKLVDDAIAQAKVGSRLAVLVLKLFCCSCSYLWLAYLQLMKHLRMVQIPDGVFLIILPMLPGKSNA